MESSSYLETFPRRHPLRRHCRRRRQYIPPLSPPLPPNLPSPPFGDSPLGQIVSNPAQFALVLASLPVDIVTMLIGYAAVCFTPLGAVLAGPAATLLTNLNVFLNAG